MDYIFQKDVIHSATKTNRLKPHRLAALKQVQGSILAKGHLFIAMSGFNSC